MRTLRGEWFRFATLSQRADRALRTSTARNTASSVYDLFTLRADRDDEQLLLNALESRPGWTRNGEREFVHNFGGRQSEVMIPAHLDTATMAALVTRAEINCLLGDSEWGLLTNLQALAARELDHLCASMSITRPRLDN